MSKSQYGERELRGDYIDDVAFAVASRHQMHGEQCLCGLSSARSRSRIEHIIDATLTGLADAGIPGLADDDPEHVCEGECSPSERARHRVTGPSEQEPDA